MFVFRAMTEYSTTAVVARRRQGVYRALKTVERVRVPRQGYLKGLVVIVPTNFTYRENFAGFLTHTPSIVRKDIRAIHESWHDRFHSRGG
jgi:hypothetical protein